MGNCTTTIPNEHVAISPNVCKSRPLSPADIANARLTSQIDELQQQLYQVKEENEWNDLIRPHQVTPSITKIPSHSFEPQNTSTTMRWQWKTINDNWVNYDANLSNKIEFLSIGECITFVSRELDKSVIIRTGADSAVHTMQLYPSFTYTKQCRRQFAELLDGEKESNRLQKQQEMYQQKIAYLERDNREKDEKIKQTKCNDDLLMQQEIKLDETRMNWQEMLFLKIPFIPNYSTLTTKQRAMVTQIKGLLHIYDDTEAVSLLQNVDWNIKQAMDIYYKDIMKPAEYVYIWKWMDNDNKWYKYEKKHMDEINKLKIGEDYQFVAGQYDYYFHKTSIDAGYQTNLTTMKCRNAKRFRQEITGVNGVKYPKFWHNDDGYHDFDGDKLYNQQSSEQIRFDADYMKTRLITMGKKSKLYQEISKNFYQSVYEQDYEIITIQSVQNKYLWNRYYDAKQVMIKSIGRKNLNEKYLWRGDEDYWIDKYVEQGFRMEVFKNKHDRAEGIELCKYAEQNMRDNVTKVIFCKVLCGESCLQSQDIKLTNWPLKQGISGHLYDSLVDNTYNPSLYYIRDDARVYPMFVVHFKQNGVNDENSAKQIMDNKRISNDGYKRDIENILLSLGFKQNYIHRAFKVYEKNYECQYNVEILTEIIVRLQIKDRAKGKKKRGG